MAQVQLVATIIAPEKLDQDEIARQIEACGKGLTKGRPQGRSRKQGQVTEGWFGGGSMVAIVLSARVHEGAVSHSRLFEILRKCRRAGLAETLRTRPDTLALEAVRSEGRIAQISVRVETRKRKQPTVNGSVAVEEKVREAA